MTSPAERFDLILVGAGLANGLIALRLAELRPELRILILEAGERPGGNHTWSFHATDLTAAQLAWTEPLLAHRWPDYTVVFPHFERTMALGYRSISSDRFADTVLARLGTAVRCGTAVAEVRPEEVRLASGEVISASAVIDGRGFRATPHLRLAYQKFVGRDLLLDRPHGLVAPILMDARVDQLGGYRFVYTLPLAADRLLVEDTYYAGTPELDGDTVRERIDRYAAARGWIVRSVVREELGVLPVVLGGDIDALLRAWGDVPCSGLRAGLFHHTTGYSLPDAVRLADLVAGLSDLSSASLLRVMGAHARECWRTQAFFRLLNRMLFLAGKPSDRYKVMRRFYGLPEPLIARFYAGRLSGGDRLRLLAGKPPVPLLGAARAAFSNGKAVA